MPLAKTKHEKDKVVIFNSISKKSDKKVGGVCLFLGYVNDFVHSLFRFFCCSLLIEVSLKKKSNASYSPSSIISFERRLKFL